jgi:membrane protease YdiL (CAAX protease family)
LKAIFIIGFFCYSSTFQLIPIHIFHIGGEQMSGLTSVLLSGFSSVMVFLILLFIYWKDLREEFKIFIKKPIENLDKGFSYYCAGFGIMIVSNLIINILLGGGGPNNEHAVQKMIQVAPWLMLIEAGLLAPFNEEIVFRKTLKDIFKNKWVFAFLSFLMFGGAHVIDSAKTFIDILYIIPYGALGGAFALAYYDTDTIFTSMTMHMIHNLILCIISVAVL